MRVWIEAVGRGDLVSTQSQSERLDIVPTVEGYGYGFGVMDAEGWIGHNGSYPPGFQTIALYDPELDQTMVVLANSYSTDGYHSSPTRSLGNSGLCSCQSPQCTRCWPWPPRGLVPASCGGGWVDSVAG